MSTHLPGSLGHGAPAADRRGLARPILRERRDRPRSLWPLYRAGYLSTFLSGKLDDGGDFALVAGAHGLHYPFYHPRSRWDDMLLVAGGRRLLAVGRRLPPLSLVLGDTGSALVAYHGLAAADGGALVDVDLHLELSATLFPPRAEGVGRGTLLLGMLWQPALVRGRGFVALNGARREIDLIAGEMERGTLRNFRFRSFRFTYDYLGLTRPGGDAVAHVAFRGRALNSGPSALPLRALLWLCRARENLTLTGRALVEGDPLRLTPALDQLETVVEAAVNVGPARLHRQLVRATVGRSSVWGLKEFFTPLR